MYENKWHSKNSRQMKHEYRSWKTDYRGDLMICAGSRNESPDLVRGHAICVVELFDITQRSPHDYVWHIRNVRFVEPFPVEGKLHLYDVDDDKIIYLSKSKRRCREVTHTKKYGTIGWN